MSEFFSSGRAADFVLFVLIAELVLLFMFRRRLPARTTVEVLLSALPGVLLLLALRASLVQWDWAWIALFLAMAFPAHVADQWYRWRVQG
jgi:hypothetical protein